MAIKAVGETDDDDEEEEDVSVCSAGVAAGLHISSWLHLLNADAKVCLSWPRPWVPHWVIVPCVSADRLSREQGGF